MDSGRFDVGIGGGMERQRVGALQRVIVMVALAVFIVGFIVLLVR